MFQWLLQFSLPYYSLVLTGSYSLMQNFQAMGWASIWQGATMDFGIISSVATLYLLLLPVICLLNILAARVLSRRLAIMITLVWFIPGLLSVSGLYHIGAVVPDTYVIGSGGSDQLGSVQGALVNSILLLLVSWSISTLFLHAMRAGKKSKSAFDHLWYMLGLTAVVFYVSDGSLKSMADNAAQHERDLSAGFSVLQPQFAKTAVRCREVSFAASNPVLCNWVIEARGFIDQRAQYNWVGRKYNDAPSSLHLFQLARDQGMDSRQIIDAVRVYNQNYCRGSNKDPDCQRIPVELNQHPDLFKGEVDIVDQYLLSVEGVLPYISYHWNAEVKARDRYESQKAVINERWAYLALLFPLFIGIKISHSSRELFGGIEASVVRKILKALAWNLWRGLIVIVSTFKGIGGSMAQRLERTIKRRG
ncbi:hypothetical protein [Pseudomonas syringae]|uniref:hypothetical protein n=1 Tax=Pseudomonas syringae TaxID=317 RepID=UPI003F7640BF